MFKSYIIIIKFYTKVHSTVHDLQVHKQTQAKPCQSLYKEHYYYSQINM